MIYCEIIATFDRSMQFHMKAGARTEPFRLQTTALGGPRILAK